MISDKYRTQIHCAPPTKIYECGARHVCMCVWVQLESRQSAHARREVCWTDWKKKEKNKNKTSSTNAIRIEAKPGGRGARVIISVSFISFVFGHEFSQPRERRPRIVPYVTWKGKERRKRGRGGGGGLRLGNTSFSSYHTRDLVQRNQCPVKVSLPDLAMYLPSSNFLFSSLSPFDKN